METNLNGRKCSPKDPAGCQIASMARRMRAASIALSSSTAHCIQTSEKSARRVTEIIWKAQVRCWVNWRRISWSSIKTIRNFSTVCSYCKVVLAKLTTIVKIQIMQLVSTGASLMSGNKNKHFLKLNLVNFRLIFHFSYKGTRTLPTANHLKLKIKTLPIPIWR